MIVSYSTLDLQSSSALDKGSNFALSERKKAELNIGWPQKILHDENQETSNRKNFNGFNLFGFRPLLKIDNNRND